jgi:uncharacterized protein YceK
MKYLKPLLLVAGGAALLGGCATHITTDIAQNPAPAEKFSAFTKFEMTKVKLAPGYAGQKANERALVKLQENVSQKMDPVLKGWNANGATATPVRTLVIETVVTEMKFINGNARFWVGPMAGSSAVILQVKITEKETGRIIATPMFFSRADAWGGTFTIGATDNIMLVRIAGRLTDYLTANYASAVGGPTGAEPAHSKAS